MAYNSKSKFSWSFTGYGDEAEAKKSLEQMEEWFRRTFSINEWEMKSSVYNSAYGFGASLIAERNVSGD